MDLMRAHVAPFKERLLIFLAASRLLVYSDGINDIPECGKYEWELLPRTVPYSP